MLRASSNATNRPVELGALVDSLADPLLRWGRELMAFTDAAVLRDRDEMAPARAALADVGGDGAVVRAAACTANFEMMNRLLDALGVRVGPASIALAAQLGLDVPEHLRPLTAAPDPPP